jgi:hypothetical protein
VGASLTTSRLLLAAAVLAAACSSGGDGGGSGGSGGSGGTSGAGGSGGTRGGSGGAGGSGGSGASAGTGGSGGSGDSLPDMGSGNPDRMADGPVPSDAMTDMAAPADTGGEAPSAGGKKILLVVGNENGTSMRGEGIGDKYLRARLEMQGYTVTIGGDNVPGPQLQMAAAASDLVIVSESVGSAMLQGKLKPVATPILNYEAFIQDEMGLTPPGPPGDPGLPANFALGVKANETSIDIVMPNHPLAAGLTGTVAVYRMPRSITWGKVAATAEVVATLPGDRAGVATYVYRKGARLQDGSIAAGLRVGFFLEDDDTTGTANLMTDDGLRLLDAAVRFTIEPGNGAPAAP